MKKICCLALCMICFASCVSRGSAEKLEQQRDALALELQAKDSLMSEVFSAVNAISENLTAIKTRENILTLGNGEGMNRPVEQIGNDIAAIDQLMQENRDKIASLERSATQLRQANVKIRGLEQMIGNLNTQIVDKNGEIVRLKENLEQIGVQMDGLTAQVNEQGEQIERLTTEKDVLEADVEDKATRLYTVYYIVGSQKELMDAQIVTRSGFIGRTLKVGEKRSLESFVKSDTRLLESVPIGRKNVTLVTGHPEDSYRLVEDESKVISELQILDPDRFWESSKILVVSYK